MSVNIVTGYTGTPHITSDDDRERIASVFGKGKYVLPVGEQFDFQKMSNNLILIRDGMLINQGTQMGIELLDFEEITIDNGLVGTVRNDFIVMRYEKDETSTVESANIIVIKGTSGDTAVDPTYQTGNILDGGDLIDDFPLYRVKIEGVTIKAVEPLFEVIDYDLESIKNTVNAEGIAIDRLNTRMNTAETRIDGKQAKLVAGQNITFKQNADGTVTINSTGGGGSGGGGTRIQEKTDIYAEHATVTTSAVGEVTT